MTADRPSNPPDGAGYDALIFDWDGTLVDFPVKYFCSSLLAFGVWNERAIGVAGPSVPV